MYSHSTSNSTLLSLGKTARKFTKASRKFESEFWKVYTLLISESWLLTAWRSGSLEKDCFFLLDFLLLASACHHSLQCSSDFSTKSDFSSKSDSNLCFRWLVKAAFLLTFEAEWDEELLVSIQLYSEKLTEKWFTKQTPEVNDYLPLKYKKRDLF